MSAHDAYEEAMKLEPGNDQAKNAFNAVKRDIQSEATAGTGADPTGGLGGIFNDPQMFQKLASNPKTSALLADGDFMSKLKRVQQNPNSVGEEIKDPRFLQVMSVLMGIDMNFGGPGEGGPSGASGAQDTPMPDARQSAPKKQPEPEPEPEDEETAAKKKAQQAGDEEKKTGNEFYKKREFDEAIVHYTKAWDLNKDVTYLNNIGAAKFEKGDLQGAIETCTNAIEEGREHRADFKILAKWVILLYCDDVLTDQGFYTNWHCTRETRRPRQGD